MATIEEATALLKTYRGDPVFGVVKVSLTDTIMGDSETVYMARADYESWIQGIDPDNPRFAPAEFYFVVNEKPSVFTGGITQWWAQTDYFETPTLIP